MKVILQRDIPKVGRGGDIVNVADGYARNYLFPRLLAVAASGGALKEHKARAARDKERGDKVIQDAQAGAEKLQGLVITVIGKVGTGTKLYGSITAQDVVDAIKKERGVVVDKRRVGLVDPIKTLGTYTIPVRLHSDISIPVTLDVLTEVQLEARAKAQADAEAAAKLAPPAPAVVEETVAEPVAAVQSEPAQVAADATEPEAAEPAGEPVNEDHPAETA